MNFKGRYPGLILVLLFACFFGYSGNIVINNNISDKVITFGNLRLRLVLDYNRKCYVTDLIVNGQTVISGPDGIFSAITTSADTFSTLKLTSDPLVETGENSITISNISYGNADESVTETWNFMISENNIKFEITRKFHNRMTVREVAFPTFSFNSINTWNGAFLGYGGLAWFYLFNSRLCTYGVHTNSSVFWNNTTGNALKVEVTSPGKQVAMKFSRSNDDKLIYSIAVADSTLPCRYETEKRSRFIRGKTDVWETFSAPAGEYVQSITLSYLDYNKDYDRGKFVGEDGRQVTSLLNTIARIGVIDENHFGGNSWHTPYGPICLHEQYIAQFAIGINDDNYTNGYKNCLDFYRDHAVNPDGRVIARWAYLNEDAMPGTVTGEGFYEAQWGYLMDSNPDFVTNVAELYSLTGDINWVFGQKQSCEKALDYMLSRDSNGNHLVEMINSSQSDRRGSDWIDIIWASYENAFVNAKLYHALTLWAEVEKQLSDNAKSGYYTAYAAELKRNFNLPTSEGGFWNPENKWYVHWLEKDKSVHGDNLVVPVNFMAIVYGICDDSIRSNAILNKIEEQTSKEQLFFWPICLYSYAIGEGNDWQFPFPNYENGDIFLSWGSLGVEAYAAYKPELALKYVDNVLARYESDGLAFQRYSRMSQQGLGDDILSGNSLAIIGLYKAIYGINPMNNRLYLNPHLPARLSGTELAYNFRKVKLQIGLETNKYSVANGQFRVTSSKDFGFYSGKDELLYFNRKDDAFSLKANTTDVISLEIRKWDSGEFSWMQSSESETGKVFYSIKVPEPGKLYTIYTGNQSVKIRSNNNGVLEFGVKSGNVLISVISG